MDGRGREIVGRIDDRSAALVADLGDKLSAIEETLVNRGGAIDEKLGQRNEEAAALFDRRLQAVEERAGAKLHEVSSTLEGLLARIEDALAQRGRALSETLARTTLETAKALGDGGREITQGMSAKSAEISDALQRRAEELTQTLSTVARDINATLTGRVEDVSRSLGVSVDQFNEQVVTPMRDLSRRLDSSRAELEGKVGEQAQQVTAMLDLHKASIGAAFDSHKVVVADATQQSVQIFDARLAALAEAADQSTRIIDVRLADMVEAANRNTEAIDERLVARIQAMSDVLTRAASEAESIWSARGAAVASAIRAKVDDLREVIEGKGADLVTALGERGDDVSARFIGVGERAMHTLDQQMAGLATLLTRRTDELIAAVNGSAADPVRALSALTGQLRSEVADSSEALRNVAADVTHRSAETIEALLKRLTEQVEAPSVSLSETVTRSAESSVGSLSGTGERLRHELTSVIDNLDQTSAVIDQAIGSAEIGSPPFKVGSRRASRNSNMRSAASHRRSPLWDAFRPRPSPTRARLPSNSPSMRKLSRLSDAISRSSSSRSTPLSNAAATASKRSSAISRAAVKPSRRHSGASRRTWKTAFARSQARAQEISAALAAATRGASIAVAGQFETIRDTAAKERERTTQTLQATIEQTNAQLTGALDHAADRFRESVAEVKNMASQVQRELDQTRQELRRGVLDLPQETSETADAMRRVVSDQIRALKELAALVSESGATYDVVEPTAATAVAGARFEKPLLRAVERARELESPTQSEVLAPVAEANAAPATENQTLGRIGGSEPAPPFARAQPQAWPGSPPAAPRPVAAPTASAPAFAADRGQPGWLSNLLAAASRDDPEETASIGAETLEALSREISSLIDNAAAVEMWDRWRRGDTGAVSRRLYTEAGQQAFDELRRRFRSDPQFRETTTRYMQEFERLLSKIGQNDRDGAQWRAYLLSNTGKVYTILAHASGKLG